MSDVRWYTVPDTTPPIKLAAPEGADAPRYKKEIVRAGMYTHPDFPDGLDFRLDTLARWVREFGERQELGHEPRLYLGHWAGTFGACGFVEKLYLEGNSLYAEISVTDPEVAAQVDAGHYRHTSPGIGTIEDSATGRRWEFTIIEISLVAEPHLRQQGPFIRLEAAKATENEEKGADMDLKLENERLRDRIAELEAAEGVKEWEAKLAAANADTEKVKAEVKKRDERIAELEKAQLEAKIESKLAELKAGHKMTAAEAEKAKGDLIELAAVKVELMDNYLAPYEARKPAPVAGQTSLNQNTGGDKVEQAVELAAKRAGVDVDEYRAKLGDRAEKSAWFMAYPGEPFPEGGE